MFLLFKNLISLERASGKNASSIRTCQRLLKAYPKRTEFWSCFSALQQVSGNESGAANVYKKAVETCDGHAQIVYHAAKFFMEIVCRQFRFYFSLSPLECLNTSCYNIAFSSCIK